MQVPILCYHSVNIAGYVYHDNDLVAFAADLEALHAAGRRIVPVQWLVDQLLGQAERDLSGCVALTCDDGAIFDARDHEHPSFGRQQSLLGSLQRFRARHGVEAQPDLHLTAFVIADPETRRQLEQHAFAGHPLMPENWWRDAEATGLVTIGNHSWDHNHPCLPSPGPDGLVRGDFHAVQTEAQAEAEISRAQDYLGARLATGRPRLFCYPFGHVSRFLHDDWLPRRGAEIGLDAAFGDGAVPVTLDSDRWNLPRYVCGWHWRSPEQLQGILDQSG